MDGFATTKEVAAYLKISTGTLDNWASQSKGPAYIKVDGGIRRYEWSDVREWVEARKVRH